jgi:ABC-type antimicrobial peptide transport system permease subunit
LPWLTVVGEIEGVKQLADQSTEEQIFIPSSQSKADAGSFAAPNMLTGGFGSIVLRGRMTPEQMADFLRGAVHSIDPQLALTQVERMDRVVSEGQAPRRFHTVLISAFAGVAVLLALLGIYSVIAFSTAMRTQEMAIRLALGSGRSNILRLILVSGAKLGLAGCGIGLVAAFFATRLLRSLIFDVDLLDPAVLVLAAVSIFGLALLASVIPARRPASVEPMVALRTE